MLGTTFANLATALGLGLLVGLQKERSDSPLAGLRTFGLVALSGGLAALIGGESPWVIVAGLLAVATLVVVGNVILIKGHAAEPGQTTEIAIIVTYLIGALAVVGPREAAIVCGATVAILLHLREELRDWVDRLSDADVRAIMQFVVISLVVLPTLPDRTYGPYDVLNPREVWLMVVLIVGINLAGYGAFRVMGARAGVALAGVLGGVISSTATTVSYARTTREDPARTSTAVAIAWIASSVVFIRLMVEIAAVAPSFLPEAAGPMVVLLAIAATLAVFAWRSATSPGQSPLDPGNPTELRPALIFGALYAVILFGIAAAQDMLGDAGLYAAAVVSGLTDVDAITLSTSQLVDGGRLDPDLGWRIIVVAVLSNLVFKVGMAATLGSRAFAQRLGVFATITVLAGLTLVLFWG